MTRPFTVQSSVSAINQVRQRIRSPFARTLLWAGLVAFVILAAALTPYGKRIEIEAFDLLTVLTAPGTKNVPIVIVGIDEPSFGELGIQWPWPRDVHARLVNSLARQGAAVIAFDVVFAEPSKPAADRIFARSIRKAGNVVLAGDLAVQKNPRFEQVMQIDPLPLFRKAGARTGIASVELDADLKLRTVPQHADALWRQIVRTYRMRSGGSASGPLLPGKARIRYLGPDHSFEYVSYYQALNPRRYLPPDIFRDKIVLIGLDVKASPDPASPQAEMFATPFLIKNQMRTPGVEIHANLVADGLSKRAIRELPRMPAVALLIGVLVLAAWLMRNWHPLPALGWACLIIGALFSASWLLFARYDLWIPVLSPAAAALSLYLVRGGDAFVVERRRKKQIRQAFALYVPPSVVDEMIAHPDRLKLGGTRRVITVMFTDLANFTALSEKMDAENVAQLLNHHLTAMTRIILQHNGTVGKFIGDAVMAFWGAPLRDPEHAVHACIAAREMQAEMERQRQDLKAAGLPAVFMRIGINTGEAVVGNMGSEVRFDYTAIGDTVNLASRLEGVNKLYGTSILLSGSSAEIVSGALALRRVDRVRVKGKAKAIDIYTPCDDTKLAKLGNEAVAAYLEQRWDESVKQWQGVLQLAPEDRIAELYLSRIEHLRRQTPAGWDGATSLDKL